MKVRNSARMRHPSSFIWLLLASRLHPSLGSRTSMLQHIGVLRRVVGALPLARGPPLRSLSSVVSSRAVVARRCRVLPAPPIHRLLANNHHQPTPWIGRSNIGTDSNSDRSSTDANKSQRNGSSSVTADMVLDGEPMSAEQMGRLGSALLFGTNGHSRNPNLARSLLSQAVDAGCLESLYNLAIMCARGDGGPKDMRRAMQLFERAALESSSLEATHHLAVIYDHGVDGIDADPVQHERWIRHGAELGNATAMCLLASLLHERLLDGGAPSDDAARQHTSDTEAEIRQLLQQAADQGHAVSQYYLGTSLGDGSLGLQRDDAAARRWLELAAEQQHPPAMYALSLMLEQGRGGDRDAVRAAALLDAATKAGFSPDGEWLDEADNW